MRIRPLFIAGMLMVLGACSFAPKDIGRAYMFALHPAQLPQHKPAEEGLTVLLPSSSPELDSYRIALMKDGGRWDYYAGARWPDFLPLIVQDNLTKTLEDAQLFQTVNSDQSGRRADVTLKTEIRRFQAEYAPGDAAPTIRLRMMVTLQKRNEGIVQSFEVSSSARAGQDRLSAIRAAFDSAFNNIQRQLVERLQIKTPGL